MVTKINTKNDRTGLCRCNVTSREYTTWRFLHARTGDFNARATGNCSVRGARVIIRRRKIKNQQTNRSPRDARARRVPLRSVLRRRRCRYFRSFVFCPRRRRRAVGPPRGERYFVTRNRARLRFRRPLFEKRTSQLRARYGVGGSDHRGRTSGRVPAETRARARARLT